MRILPGTWPKFKHCLTTFVILQRIQRETASFYGSLFPWIALEKYHLEPLHLWNTTRFAHESEQTQAGKVTLTKCVWAFQEMGLYQRVRALPCFMQLGNEENICVIFRCVTHRMWAPKIDKQGEIGRKVLHTVKNSPRSKGVCFWHCVPLSHSKWPFGSLYKAVNFSHRWDTGVIILHSLPQSTQS